MVYPKLTLHLIPDAPPSAAGLTDWIKNKFKSKSDPPTPPTLATTPSTVASTLTPLIPPTPLSPPVPSSLPPGPTTTTSDPTQVIATFCDHISSIAARYRYQDWQTLWNKNPALKSKRKTPHVLFHGDKRVPQGDIVLLPDMPPKTEPATINKMNNYVVPVAALFLRLQILDEDLKPVKGAAYTLTIDGSSQSGKTDDNGRIQAPISKGAQIGSVVIKPVDSTPPPTPPTPGTPGAITPPTPPKPPTPVIPGAPLSGNIFTFPLYVGRLDPILEQAPDTFCIAGIQARLNNLGFDCGAVDGVKGPNTTAAIKRFQKRLALKDIDGSADTPTQSKLKTLHDTDNTAWPAIAAPGTGQVGSLSGPTDSSTADDLGIAGAPKKTTAPAAQTITVHLPVLEGHQIDASYDDATRNAIKARVLAELQFLQAQGVGIGFDFTRVAQADRTGRDSQLFIVNPDQLTAAQITNIYQEYGVPPDDAAINKNILDLKSNRGTSAIVSGKTATTQSPMFIPYGFGFKALNAKQLPGDNVLRPKVTGGVMANAVLHEFGHDLMLEHTTVGDREVISKPPHIMDSISRYSGVTLEDLALIHFTTDEQNTLTTSAKARLGPGT